MKGSQCLSQFQKDQYAAYLESQLEKFSSFMLAQRKENDKYQQLEQIIAQHHNSLTQMKGQIELIECYQHQNLQNCEHIHKKISKLDNIEHQLQRLEDRYRLAFAQESKFGNAYECTEKSAKQDMLKDIDQRVSKIEKSNADFSKKIKAIEEEIDRNKDLILGICKSKALPNDQENQNYASHKDIKKLQKKMHKYFEEKFSEIEEIMKKNQRKRSKSPSFRTPIDFVHTFSSAEQTQKLLSEFRINDQSSMKSDDASTLSRETKRTPVSKEGEVFKKQKKGKESKSRSKSRSKKCLDRSKSQSKKQLSSNKQKGSKQKSPKPSKDRKQISIQKSRRSSLSCGKQHKQKGSKSMMRKKVKQCPESCGTRCG